MLKRNENRRKMPIKIQKQLRHVCSFANTYTHKYINGQFHTLKKPDYIEIEMSMGQWRQ